VESHQKIKKEKVVRGIRRIQLTLLKIIGCKMTEIKAGTNNAVPIKSVEKLNPPKRTLHLHNAEADLRYLGESTSNTCVGKQKLP